MSKVILETLVLGASEQLRLYTCNAWSFLLLTNDQSTEVQIGIETEDVISWPAWRKYTENRPGKRFNKIYFSNPTASVMTITFYVSEGDVDVATEYGSLTNLATLLTTIDGVLDSLLAAQDVADTPAAIAEATIAQTGVGSTQIVTASANKRRLEVQADYGNTGAVYIGFATGVTAANCAIVLQPGQSIPIIGNVNVWASSANGTEKARGYTIATA